MASCYFRLGKLGAVFGSRRNYIQESIIYASRPGLRLWQADKVGTVLKTLIFKVCSFVIFLSMVFFILLKIKFSKGRS